MTSRPHRASQRTVPEADIARGICERARPAFVCPREPAAGERPRGRHPGPPDSGSNRQADGWYPLRSALEVLDQVETRFGDGTYETVRRMMRDEAINFSSLRRFLKRVIPFPILLELSPNSYAREFNHGRLEVDVEGHRAIFRNYDWMSSPARCAAWLGTYEGSLIMLGIAGTVTKVACILRGDPYCGYRIDW